MWTWSLAAVAGTPCVDHPASVVVDGARHRMWLCDPGGGAAGPYRVSLGRGGLGKRREGDGKTPLGRYRLGPSRPSFSGYHRFIPIAYPTPVQRREGFTGGAIGIHGPPEGWPEVPKPLRWGDWTLGCIALWSVADLVEVDRWIGAHRVRWIVIGPSPAGEAGGSRPSPGLDTRGPVSRGIDEREP